MMNNQSSRQPLGAASLAQAHLASLHDGGEVVVKILRPGIHILVKIDLAAINLVCGWRKMFKDIRDSMDLDRLVEEFTTTRNELDLLKERENIERFTDDFKDDSHVYRPRKAGFQYCRKPFSSEVFARELDIGPVFSQGAWRGALGVKPRTSWSRRYAPRSPRHALPIETEHFVPKNTQ